jgi:soluble lytic murein transglycosylase-like protein
MKDKLELVEIRKVSETIVDECAKLGVDHLFIIAIIEAESNFDIEAVSPTGARGLMQIMPGTFREVSKAKRMFDPSENVRAGIRYVAKLYSQGFTTPWDVLLAYNQGPGTVLAVWKKQLSMPDEAQAYIPRVMSNYKALLVKSGKDPRNTKKLFMITSA